MSMPMRMSLTRAALSIVSACVVQFGWTGNAEAGRYTADFEESPSAAAMVADLLIARPLGLATTIVGASFYVAALPFAAMAGDITTPGERMVADPARFTFDRPLGRIP